MGGLVCDKCKRDHAFTGGKCLPDKTVSVAEIAKLIKPTKADIAWAKGVVDDMRKEVGLPVAKVRTPRPKKPVQGTRHGKYKDEDKRREYQRLKNKEYRAKQREYRKNRKEKP